MRARTTIARADWRLTVGGRIRAIYVVRNPEKLRGSSRTRIEPSRILRSQLTLGPASVSIRGLIYVGPSFSLGTVSARPGARIAVVLTQIENRVPHAGKCVSDAIPYRQRGGPGSRDNI
jgi:hypothetical protein